MILQIHLLKMYFIFIYGNDSTDNFNMHEWNCKFNSYLCPQCRSGKGGELDQIVAISILGAFRAMLLSQTQLSRTKILLLWDIVKTKSAYKGYLEKLECVLMNGPDNTLMTYFENLLLPKEALTKSSQRITGSGSKSGMGAEGQQEEESSQRITGSGSKSGIGAEGQQERESSQRKTGKGSKSGKSNTNEEVPMNPQAQAFVDRFRQQRSTGSASNFFGDKLASVVPMAKSKKRPPLRRTNAVHGDDDSNDIELDFTMEKKKRTEDHT
jgi:hypothetical protein